MNRAADHVCNERASFREYDAVAAVLQLYIDAARTGDSAGVRGIWFEHARIIGPRDGQLVNLDPDAFCSWVDREGGSPGVRARVASIHVAGRAACARIEILDWHGVRFTDFFVLVKRHDQWIISGKVFDSHSRNG